MHLVTNLTAIPHTDQRKGELPFNNKKLPAETVTCYAVRCNSFNKYVRKKTTHFYLKNLKASLGCKFV